MELILHALNIGHGLTGLDYVALNGAASIVIVAGFLLFINYSR